MNIDIQQETKSDEAFVFEIIKEAFQKEEYSDQQEHFLVERLRKSDVFIPQLSLSAKFENQIIGHILMTKIKIKNQENTYDSLALAPVSVLPKFQGKGVGTQLIQEAHKKAKELGFESVVLLGHKDYYPKFGYKQAHTFSIELPFEVPKENCMAIELTEGALKNISGVVEYPKEFGL